MSANIYNPSTKTLTPYAGSQGINQSMIFSTDERPVGTWVTGDTLYQKTVTTNDPVPTGATLIQRIVQTGYDTLLYIK